MQTVKLEIPSTDEIEKALTILLLFKEGKTPNECFLFSSPCTLYAQFLYSLTVSDIL